MTPRAALIALACMLAAAPAAQAALPTGFVGIYGDDAYFGDPGYRSLQFAMQARAGVQTLRQPLEWWRVETRPGQFDFSAYDAFVDDAARARLRVLPVLMAPPAFRSSRPRDGRSDAMYPPRSGAAFAAFARAAVARYGSGGSFWRERPWLPYVPMLTWQVWNEPNIPNFWRSGPDARAYVALLRHAAGAIRAADARARVVAGGLPNSALGVPLLRYLRRMYAAGARGSFDVLAVHPYSRDAAGVPALVESVRAVMDRHGDRSQIWITELGWSTSGDASAFRVGEHGQADRIAASLAALVAQRRALRLRGIVLFKWRDSLPPAGLDRDPWPLHTGLLRADGSPKRGFWAFARLVHALSDGARAWPAGSAALARVDRRPVRLSPRGHAAVVLRCDSDRIGACAGVLRLRSARAVECGGRRLAAGARLGRARFRVAVAPALVPVRVRLAARRVAVCAGSIRVRASVAPLSRRAGAGASRSAAGHSVEFVLRAR